MSAKDQESPVGATIEGEGEGVPATAITTSQDQETGDREQKHVEPSSTSIEIVTGITTKDQNQEEFGDVDRKADPEDEYEEDENDNKKDSDSDSGKVKLLDQIVELQDADKCLKRVMSIPFEDESTMNMNETEAREYAEEIISDMEEDLVQFLKFWGVVRETPEGPQRLYI